MNFNKRINGLVLRPLSEQNYVFCVLVLFIVLFARPLVTHAGLLDFSAKIFNFAKNSVEAGQRIGEIREGTIAPEVATQLKETGEVDNLQVLLEEFPDEKVQKSLRGYYVFSNELSNKDSLFIKGLVGSGVDVVASSYGNPSIGLSSELPPTLEEMVKPPFWVKVVGGIKDFAGAVKTLLGGNENNKEVSKELPGQIGQALKSGYRDCPAYIYLIGEYPKNKLNIPAIQTKVNALNIGEVALRQLNDGKIFISIKGDKAAGPEAHQALIGALSKLGQFQEVKLDGRSALRSSKCLTEDEFINSNTFPLDSPATPQQNTQTSQPQKATQQNPTIATLDRATAEKLILQKLKTDDLNWPVASVSYDEQRGGYFDILSKLRGSYEKLESLGLVTVIGREEPMTLLVNFLPPAEPYLIKNKVDKAQGIVEALPENVAVKEISTDGFDINSLHSCIGDCYIVTYTATYQRTPFGQAFNSPSKNAYEASAIVSPLGSCWEVYTVLIHTAEVKRICL